jgi:hypothetical protein
MNSGESSPSPNISPRTRRGALPGNAKLPSPPTPKCQLLSIFNIGTGHRKHEPNNTIAALGKACEPSIVNDGPTGAAGTLQGWGMNDALARTMAQVEEAQPAVVNMAGHSRGAILCHMLAHSILTSDKLRDTQVNLCVLDPVHQSWMPHVGGELLLDNPRLLSYYAIAMENESGFGGKKFPLKFVTPMGEGVRERMYYTSLPGTHGSASQNLTSAIGAVGYAMMAAVMRGCGSQFSTPRPSPLDWCEMFAKIHVENPKTLDGAKRLIRDDKGEWLEHRGKVLPQGTAVRASDIAKALQIGSKHVSQPGYKKLVVKPGSDYFFNREHASHFKQVFPYFFSALAHEGTFTLHVPAFQKEAALMDSRPSLSATFPILYAEMAPKFGM